jgi:hypothetical protein
MIKLKRSTPEVFLTGEFVGGVPYNTNYYNPHGLEPNGITFDQYLMSDPLLTLTGKDFYRKTHRDERSYDEVELSVRSDSKHYDSHNKSPVSFGFSNQNDCASK